LPLALDFIDVVGYTLAGFIAGEGCFTTTRLESFADGSPRVRWKFQVAVATRDRPLLEALREFLGVGAISDAPPRREHWQPISTFTVSSRRALLRQVVPFADRYLLRSAKRSQFETWRSALRDYDELHPPRSRSKCSVPGCDGFVRGRGLCRSHYYRETGY
jgi:hypothetical protein